MLGGGNKIPIGGELLEIVVIRKSSKYVGQTGRTWVRRSAESGIDGVVVILN